MEKHIPGNSQPQYSWRSYITLRNVGLYDQTIVRITIINALTHWKTEQFLNLYVPTKTVCNYKGPEHLKHKLIEFLVLKDKLAITVRYSTSHP